MQADMAKSVMPWMFKERADVASQQIEQFAFLTKLQMKHKFESYDEIVRLFLILGGREKLIYMNNVAAAAANPNANAENLWDGLARYFSRNRVEGVANGNGEFEPSDRFLKSYNEDDWFVAASQRNTKVRRTLEQLAIPYLHLFPRLMIGKLDPFGPVPNQRAAQSRNAAVLVKAANDFCITSEPSSFIVNALRDVNIHEGAKPRHFGGAVLRATKEGDGYSVL